MLSLPTALGTNSSQIYDLYNQQLKVKGNSFAFRVALNHHQEVPENAVATFGGVEGGTAAAKNLST